MSIVRNVIVASSLAVVLVACGKSSEKGADGGATTTSGTAPKGGSCNLEKSGICHEYADSALGLVEGMCTGMLKGKYAKASCSTQNLMGTCEQKDEKKLYYFGNAEAPWVADAKEDCEKNAVSPGKWTATPGAEETAKSKGLPGADKIGGSCAQENVPCEDVIGEVEIKKTSCESFGGKWSDKACVQDKLVASCLKNGKIARYSDKDLKRNENKMSELQENCEKFSIPFGHFYPGPDAPAAVAAAAPKGGAPAKAGGATAGGGAAKGKKRP